MARKLTHSCERGVKWPTQCQPRILYSQVQKQPCYLSLVLKSAHSHLSSLRAKDIVRSDITSGKLHDAPVSNTTQLYYQPFVACSVTGLHAITIFHPKFLSSATQVAQQMNTVPFCTSCTKMGILYHEFHPRHAQTCSNQHRVPPHITTN